MEEGRRAEVVERAGGIVYFIAWMSQRVLEVFRGLPLLPLSHEIVARCWDRMVRQRDVYYQFAVHVSHCHERLSTRNLLRLVTHVHHVLAPMNELPAHLRRYQSEYHALVASWPTVTERQILDAMELGKGMAVRIPHNKTLRQMFEQHEWLVQQRLLDDKHLKRRRLLRCEVQMATPTTNGSTDGSTNGNEISFRQCPLTIRELTPLGALESEAKFKNRVRSDVHSLWRLLAVQHPPLSRPHADELVRTLKRTLGTSRTDRSIARAYLQLLQRAYTYTYTYTDTEAEAQLQYSRVSQLVSH